MSKQPSERAFDVASTWQGHTLWCVIYRDPGQDDADCTCIVRDLALAIDAAIASARREAVEECERIARGLYTGPHKSVPLGVPGMGYRIEVVIRNTCGDRIADEIAALAAQEARDGAQ